MDIKNWKQAIVRSESMQQKQHNMWKDSLDMVSCDYFEKMYGGVDLERVDVHFANWYHSNLVALTYFRDPYIFISSRNDALVSFADTMEQVVNVVWKDLRLKNEFKRAISSAFIMPPGWIKIGYTAEVGQDIDKLDDVKEKSLIDSVKSIIKGVFKEDEVKRPEEKGELNFYIKEESCFVTWIPSWNVLMPEGYHLVSRMPYLIEIESMKMIDFIHNPLYKNKDNLKADRSLNDNLYDGKRIDKVPFLKGGERTSDGDVRETDVIKLYHVWDRRSNKRYTISMQSDEYHFEGDWPYDMTGFPLKPLIFEESLPLLDNDSPYPINMLKPIKPQIIEQSQLRTQMGKWRKRASAIILAQKGLLTEEDMNQLEETEALQIAYISNISAVQMQQTPALPQGVFQIDDVIQGDLQSATQMGQMMFQAPPGTRTATQANLAQGGMQLKSQARVDVVEDFTVDVAESLAQTIWQFYDRDKIAEILGMPISPDMWPDLPSDKMERKKIIKQYMHIRIDAGSTAPPKDETVDRKQILDFASIVMSIAPEKINKDEFVKQLIKKFKFTKEVDRMVVTNDAEEQEAAQEENGLMAQGHPQIVSPNENHQLHIQVHSQGAKNHLTDLHIQDHAKHMGVMPGGQGPQKGDVRPPMKSSNPEIARQGITNQGDIHQSVQNVGVGSGAEAQ